VSDGRVTEIGRIHALRKQSEGVEEILVLSVIIETDCSLNLSATNPEPALEAVIGDRPVEGWMVLAELPKVAVVALRADPELIRDWGRHIQPKIGEGAAALAGIHGQPVVVVGVGESLRHEAVDLDHAVQKFKLLCLHGDLARLETQIGKGQAKNSLVHTDLPRVYRDIGVRPSAKRSPRKREPKTSYIAKEIVCSREGFQLWAKLLISELSIILSSETGIFR
jgi:hypothetical protein